MRNRKTGRFVKRLARAALSFALVLSLAACSGGGGSSSGGTGGGEGGTGTGGAGTQQNARASVNKDLVWREEPLTIDAGDYKAEEFSDISIHDGRLMAFGLHPLEFEGEFPTGDVVTGEWFLVSAAPDGSDVQSIKLADVKNNEYYSYPRLDEEGNIYAIRTQYPQATAEEAGPGVIIGGGSSGAVTVVSEGGDAVVSSGTEEAAAEGEEAEGEEPADMAEYADDVIEPVPVGGDASNVFLVKLAPSGERLWEVKLSPEERKENEWYSVSSLIYVPDQGLVLSDDKGIGIYETEDGTKRGSFTVEEQYPTLSVSGSGKVYYTTWGENGMILNEVDVANAKEGERVDLGQTSYRYDFYDLKRGDGCDFLISANNGIYTWNVGDEEPVQILSYVDSDMDVSYLQYLTQIDETQMFAMYHSEGAQGMVLSRLTKVAPEDIKDRTTLVLGCNWIGSDVRRSVVDFNKAQEDYRITILDYQQYVTDDDWQAGYKQLNADIIAGNAPDILVLDDSQYVQSYVSKGVLEPLDDYMANDAELSSKEFLTGVLDAYRVQGKMYLVTPGFYTRTYAIRKSDYEQMSAWSLPELKKYADARGITPENMFGDWPMSKDNLLMMAVVFDSSTYLDWTEHRAKFDSQEFIELLNFARQFPDEIADSFWEKDRSGMYRTGEALVAQAFLSGFSDYMQLRYGTFGDEIVFAGFPREEGEGGASVMATAQYAMSAATPHKDACWDYLRTFYTDEYQDTYVNGSNWAFPVGMTQLKALAEKAKEPETWTDENGEVHTVQNKFYFGEDEIEIPLMSDADEAQVFAMFETLDSSYNYDETLMKIIQEEAAPFFKGQKSAEEVAKIIQSKVQIYLDENS